MVEKFKSHAIMGFKEVGPLQATHKTVRLMSGKNSLQTLCQ